MARLASSGEIMMSSEGRSTMVRRTRLAMRPIKPSAANRAGSDVMMAMSPASNSTV